MFLDSLTALMLGCRLLSGFALVKNGCLSNSLVSALTSGSTSRHLSKKFCNSFEILESDTEDAADDEPCCQGGAVATSRVAGAAAQTAVKG